MQRDLVLLTFSVLLPRSSTLVHTVPLPLSSVAYGAHGQDDQLVARMNPVGGMREIFNAGAQAAKAALAPLDSIPDTVRLSDGQMLPSSSSFESSAQYIAVTQRARSTEAPFVEPANDASHASTASDRHPSSNSRSSDQNATRGKKQLSAKKRTGPPRKLVSTKDLVSKSGVLLVEPRRRSTWMLE